MGFSITIRPIMPKKTFAGKPWKAEVQKALRQTGRDLKGLFGKTVFGWSKKPTFSDTYSNINNVFYVKVEPAGPNAEIWKLVNAGSPWHEIKPKKGGLLSFRPGYRASTTPGQLMSHRAYRSGKQMAARKVDHPGFEARRFTETIRDEYEKQFGEDMQAALNNAARK